jgi:hypothetical protein
MGRTLLENCLQPILPRHTFGLVCMVFPEYRISLAETFSVSATDEERLCKKKQNVVLTECYLIFESEKNEEGRVNAVNNAKI